jgi:hypothetical protein
MKTFKNKILLVATIGLMLSLSACGIFKKDCNCPKFGLVKGHTIAKPA